MHTKALEGNTQTILEAWRQSKTHGKNIYWSASIMAESFILMTQSKTWFPSMESEDRGEWAPTSQLSLVITCALQNIIETAYTLEQSAISASRPPATTRATMSSHFVLSISLNQLQEHQPVRSNLPQPGLWSFDSFNVPWCHKYFLCVFHTLKWRLLSVKHWILVSLGIVFGMKWSHLENISSSYWLLAASIHIYV